MYSDDMYCELFLDLLFSVTDVKEWQKKIVRKYLKNRNMPLISRLRCRWRPRESRRKLEGLSPGVVIDEMNEWKGEL